jgi:hypothetical protein
VIKIGLVFSSNGPRFVEDLYLWRKKGNPLCVASDRQRERHLYGGVTTKHPAVVFRIVKHQLEGPVLITYGPAPQRVDVCPRKGVPPKAS